MVERIHDRLDPVLVDLGEELLDGFLGLCRCWISGNGCTGTTGIRGRRL